MGLYEDLKEKIGKLRKNREKISREELRVRYRDAYYALLGTIRDMTEKAVLKCCVEDLEFMAADRPQMESFLMKVNGIFSLEKKIFKEISYAVFEDYDLDKALDIVMCHLKPKVDMAYYPYWLSHCVYAQDGIWNNLVNMWWNNEAGVWTSSTQKDTRWTSKFPPVPLGSGQGQLPPLKP